MAGLFMGRFQPFHGGHLEAIRKILEGGERLIIGIGTIQESGTDMNPFTAEERERMIKGTLDSEGTPSESYDVVKIRDMGTDELWISEVERVCPKFETVYMANTNYKKLFEEKGYRVVVLPVVNRDNYSATKIRGLIREGGNWEELVPSAVAEIINEVPDRMNDLKKSENKLCQVVKGDSALF